MNQLTVSLWGDEAFASILAQKNIHDIITIVARDTSPPLHYILLHFWMATFGTSEIAIRTLPMLLFVLLAFVVHKFTEDVFGKKASIWAFFLTLLNPFLFLYAFEARMYMLLAFTSTASLWFYATNRWKWYIVATAAALYTHHFALFIVIVQVIHFLATNRFDIIKKLSSPFIRALVITILIYVPWLPFLYGQTKMVQGDFWLPKPSFDDLRFLFAHFIAGSTKLGVEKLVLYVGLLLLILRGFQKKKDSVLYLWLTLPAVLTYFMSQIGRPLFFDRYLIISAPAIPMLLASQNWPKANIKNLTIALLAIVTLGLIFINTYAFNHPVKQPFRDVASYIHEAYGQDKMVINYYTSALHYFELRHYGVNVKVYSPQGPLPFWVGTALIDPRDVLEKLPQEPMLLVMASGDIQRVVIPGYTQLRYQQFGDLYLLWFLKN